MIENKTYPKHIYRKFSAEQKKQLWELRNGDKEESNNRKRKVAFVSADESESEPAPEAKKGHRNKFGSAAYGRKKTKQKDS